MIMIYVSVIYHEFKDKYCDGYGRYPLRVDLFPSD